MGAKQVGPAGTRRGGQGQGGYWLTLQQQPCQFQATAAICPAQTRTTTRTSPDFQQRRAGRHEQPVGAAGAVHGNQYVRTGGSQQVLHRVGAKTDKPGGNKEKGWVCSQLVT